MIDGLAAVQPVVDNQPIAAVQAFVPRNLCRNVKQVAKQVAVALGCLADRCDVLSGYDENVRGRLGTDVGEGVDAVVLINRARRDLTGDDLAEQAAHSQISVQDGGLTGVIEDYLPTLRSLVPDEREDAAVFFGFAVLRSGEMKVAGNDGVFGRAA